jgi:hypothetical protein
MFKKFSPLILVIMVLAAGNDVKAQICDSIKASVNAPSGLILRETPGKGYISTLVKGDLVAYCADSSYGSLTYEGINGFWRKVSVRGKIGYCFDGFLSTIELKEINKADFKNSDLALSKADSFLGHVKASEETETASKSPHSFLGNSEFQFLTETYNFCGPVESINMDLYWYGVFMDNPQNPTGSLRIQPLDLKVSLSKRKIANGLEFDIMSNMEERSLFLFGVSGSYGYQENTLGDVFNVIGTRGSRLFPGQEWLLENSSRMRLSAAGSIIKAGPCPQAENYTISVIMNGPNGEIIQDLKGVLGDYGTCSIPEIYWYGDLSGDGLPEIIFVSVQDDKNVFSFLQSNPNSDQIFTLKSVFTVENCK